MPRKPKQNIVKTTVVIKGITIPVTLYPPRPPRTSWYVFWPDLVGAKSTAALVADEFNPNNLGKWFERRLFQWSRTLPKGRASIHVFRKTSLQYARRGEDVNDQVARDARLGTNVMMRNYVKLDDPERRSASNRTFYRIATSLAPATARRYGHLIAQASREHLERAIQAAVEAKDRQWVSQLSVELGSRYD
jgi:hypothetical protein